MKNLRFIILLFTLLLFTSPSNAQVGKHRNDFSVGLTGGYTLNTVNFYPAIKQSMKGAPEFGFVGRYICEKYFTTICGVQIELNYQNLGWTENIEDDPDHSISGLYFTRNLHCIEIPAMMQMGWGYERRGLKFIFEAGPYIQYFLASDQDSNFDLNAPGYRPNNVKYQYTNDIDHKVAYGIKAGIGTELTTAVGHFLLTAHYCYGLGDMYDSSKRGYFGRSANSTIEAKLTYLFDLVKTKNPEK